MGHGASAGLGGLNRDVQKKLAVQAFSLAALGHEQRHYRSIAVE